MWFSILVVMNYYLSIKHKTDTSTLQPSGLWMSLSYLLVFSQQPSTRLLNFLLCIQHYIFNVTVNNFTFFLFQNTNDINKFDILTVIFLVQHLWFLFHSLFLSLSPSFSLTRKKLHIFEYMYVLSPFLFSKQNKMKQW